MKNEPVCPARREEIFKLSCVYLGIPEVFLEFDQAYPMLDLSQRKMKLPGSYQIGADLEKGQLLIRDGRVFKVESGGTFKVTTLLLKDDGSFEDKATKEDTYNFEGSLLVPMERAEEILRLATAYHLAHCGDDPDLKLQVWYQFGLRIHLTRHLEMFPKEEKAPESDEKEPELKTRLHVVINCEGLDQPASVALVDDLLTAIKARLKEEGRTGNSISFEFKKEDTPDGFQD